MNDVGDDDNEFFHLFSHREPQSDARQTAASSSVESSVVALLRSAA